MMPVIIHNPQCHLTFDQFGSVRWADQMKRKSMGEVGAKVKSKTRLRLWKVILYFRLILV